VTTKHQEVFTFVRPTFYGDPAISPAEDKFNYPDLHADQSEDAFYRPEPPTILCRLPALRPAVLYIYGGESKVSRPEWCTQRIQLTGKGLGGSGGARAGHVKSITLENCGHLLVMENPKGCAEAAAGFIGARLAIWQNQRSRMLPSDWSSRSQAEKMAIDEKFKNAIDGQIQIWKSTDK
jgi:pimeloyl-ACP methyl ester carboxylesterase